MTCPRGARQLHPQSFGQGHWSWQARTFRWHLAKRLAVEPSEKHTWHTHILRDLNTGNLIGEGRGHPMSLSFMMSTYLVTKDPLSLCNESDVCMALTEFYLPMMSLNVPHASQFEVYKNGCTFQVQNSYRPRVPFQTKGQQVCSTVKTRAILQYIYGDHINMIHMCQARWAL